MKTFSSGFDAILSKSVFRPVLLWTITRRDGETYRFAVCDEDITINSGDYAGTYSALSGVGGTAYETKVGGSVDNLDVFGVLSSDAITEEDLRNELFDGAAISLLFIDGDNPDLEQVLILKGWFGETTIEDGKYTIELRSLTQVLNQNCMLAYSHICRAELGDYRCGIDTSLPGYNGTGSVVSIISLSQFETDLTADTQFYTYGILTWTSGLNNGVSCEVLSQEDAVVTLLLPVAKNISIGDTFSIRVGCDKQSTTCRDKFDNIINFQGEPFLPGMSAIVRYPNAK